LCITQLQAPLSDGVYQEQDDEAGAGDGVQPRVRYRLGEVIALSLSGVVIGHFSIAIAISISISIPSSIAISISVSVSVSLTL